MTPSSMDSFDQSPLGAFHESPLKARGGLACNIIVWDVQRAHYPNSLSSVDALVALYQSWGHGVRVILDPDEWDDPIEAIHDYNRFVWPVSGINNAMPPPWWPWHEGQAIADNWAAWQGRVITNAEHSDFYGLINWFNEKIAPYAGIGITPAQQDCYCDPPKHATTETHALTAGQTWIRIACVSYVNAGTVLSRTPTTAGPWLAVNATAGKEYVVAGDSNHIVDQCPGHAAYNAQYHRNCIEVEVT